jgi:hypothetical protein
MAVMNIGRSIRVVLACLLVAAAGCEARRDFVDVQVPAGYRGLLRVREKPASSECVAIDSEQPKLDFPAKGEICVKSIRPLVDSWTKHRVRDSNGKRIDVATSSTPSNAVAFRIGGTTGSVCYYLIGTEDDWKKYQDVESIK